MATKITIAEGSWFPGAATSFRIDVEDAAGDPQTMTGWSLAFVVNDGRRNVLTKTTSDDVSIGNGSGTDDRATVAIAPADTLGLPAGLYRVALWRTDGSNDVPLAWGYATLTGVAAP